VDLSRFARFIEQEVPFNALLGVKVVRLEPGFTRFEVPFRAQLIGDPSRPAMHGGVISAVADAAGGFAVWSATDILYHRISTIDLRVDYLRPGRALDFAAEAKVLRVGGQVGVAGVSVLHLDAPDKPIATAIGVYAIRRVKQPLTGVPG